MTQLMIPTSKRNRLTASRKRSPSLAATARLNLSGCANRLLSAASTKGLLSAIPTSIGGRATVVIADFVSLLGRGARLVHRPRKPIDTPCRTPVAIVPRPDASLTRPGATLDRVD